MTPLEFTEWAQGYYGDYRQGQKRDIWDYLKVESPEYLDALKAAVLKSFSSQYGKPPDVAIFEQCRPDAEAIMEARRPKVQVIEDAGKQASPADVADFIAAYEKKYGRACPLSNSYVNLLKPSKIFAKLPEKSTIC